MLVRFVRTERSAMSAETFAHATRGQVSPGRRKELAPMTALPAPPSRNPAGHASRCNYNSIVRRFVGVPAPDRCRHATSTNSRYGLLIRGSDVTWSCSFPGPIGRDFRLRVAVTRQRPDRTVPAFQDYFKNMFETFKFITKDNGWLFYIRY